LADSFTHAVVLNSRTDTKAITTQAVTYIVEPKIDTHSSSDNIFFGPAKDFTIKVTCTFSDTDGNLVAIVSAVGTGHADLSDMLNDHSAAGKRAATDALIKLGAAIRSAPEFRR
jgi:hypothetical protein